MLLWAWEKSKVSASVRTTNTQGSPMTQVRERYDEDDASKDSGFGSQGGSSSRSSKCSRSSRNLIVTIVTSNVVP